MKDAGVAEPQLPSENPPPGEQRERTLRNGFLIYAQHVLGLIRPGHPLPRHEDPDTSFRAPLEGWKSEDLQLMIAEGRRQFDEQLSHLERIRGRAQWLFTVGLAVGTALATVGSDVFDEREIEAMIVWFGAAIAATYALLGAAAILTGRADFDSIATKPLSKYKPPIEPLLARDYAEMLEGGEMTVNTRLSLFRQAVGWMLLGGYLTLIAFLLSR